MRLTRRHLNALKYLADPIRVNRWIMIASIPDGNGHTSSGGASWITMKELKDSGLVEYGRDPQHSLCGYRITDAGLAALRERE